ncbi:hypothetical protein ABL78_6367 [Leptomonas seymouri]|uniref:Uncharacterized protein n=1 Tax=Leptomonas seymouri TaxID=5684 RepID=A0A0N0P497_LEPSE|nr:hypothetical protein ABL78_6367 [Leptomonas seymouri]|eukprot:KPI84577.1 hypothetical protein ABL78_6367 [Leptomonas seymouri]
MGEPLVVSISANAAGSSAKALSYVALRSHEGKHVILPVAAAAGSRVLHGLFQGLSVMQLHQCAAAVSESANDEVLPAAAQPPSEGSPIPTVDDDKADEEQERGAKESGSESADRDGAAFHSYAATFPATVVCQPPSALAPSPPFSSKLLEVPLRSLETTTLARVAEFLVVKCTLASNPHFLHTADVFSDLDRTSERDQLTAMQLLLGADFLNC